MCAHFFLSVGQCLTPCELHACPLWVMRVHARRLVIECDRNTDSKNKNIIWMLVRVHGPDIGPGAVWLAAWLGLAGPGWGLAVAWLEPDWDLTGPSQPSTGQASRLARFVRLQLIGNSKFTNYQLT